MNRAPLDRDVRPERSQRRLEPGCAVDETNSGAFRPRRVMSSRKAVQAAVLSPPMFLGPSRTFWPSRRTPIETSREMAGKRRLAALPLAG